MRSLLKYFSNETKNEISKKINSYYTTGGMDKFIQKIRRGSYDDTVDQVLLPYVIETLFKDAHILKDYSNPQEVRIMVNGKESKNWYFEKNPVFGEESINTFLKRKDNGPHWIDIGQTIDLGIVLSYKVLITNVIESVVRNNKGVLKGKGISEYFHPNLEREKGKITKILKEEDLPLTLKATEKFYDSIKESVELLHSMFEGREGSDRISIDIPNRKGLSIEYLKTPSRIFISLCIADTRL